MTTLRNAPQRAGSPPGAPRNTASGGRPAACLTAAGILWGSSFLFGKWALASVGPAELTLWRFAIAASTALWNYQDFVLGSVPKTQAGTAGGMLYTAQRIGAAIGIAAIGTALFGSGSGGKPGAIDPHLVSTAQLATIVNLGFILAALACGLVLPRTLGAEENR